MTNATDVLAYLSTLEGKVDNSSTLYSKLNASANQTKLDDHSDHTYYGINEDTLNTLKIAADLIDLTLEKVKSVTG